MKRQDALIATQKNLNSLRFTSAEKIRKYPQKWLFLKKWLFFVFFVIFFQQQYNAKS